MDRQMDGAIQNIPIIFKKKKKVYLKGVGIKSNSCQPCLAQQGKTICEVKLTVFYSL